MKRFVTLVGLMGILGFAPAWAGDTDKAKDSYLKKADGEIQEWTLKLKSLQERSEKTGAKARREFDRDLKTIDEQLSVARTKLEGARTSEEGTRQKFRQGLEETLRDIKRDYRKAVSFFNKNEAKEKS